MVDQVTTTHQHSRVVREWKTGLPIHTAEGKERQRQQKTGLPMAREEVDRNRLSITTAKAKNRGWNTGLPISRADTTDRERDSGQHACLSEQQKQ